MLFKNVTQKEVNEEIIKFWEQKDILRPRKNYSLNRINRSFGEFKDLNEKIFDELVLLVKEEPQLVIKTTKDFFDKRETLTKLFSLVRKRKGKKDDDLTVFDRIEAISFFYETVETLKPGAYLLSQRKASFDGLNSKDSILKYFKQLGLSNNDRNNIRLIRNADSHKFSIKNNSIVTVDGDEIEIDEIEVLQKKVEHIFSWWATFFVTNMLFIPKLGLLTLMGVYLSINNNKDEWEKYSKGIELFFADIIDEQKKEKEKEERKLRNRIKRLRAKIRIFLIYKVLRKIGINKDKDFFFNNASFIMGRLEYHLQCFIKEVDDIIINIKDEGDKKSIQKLSKWLEKHRQDIAEIVNFQIDHPDKFQDRLDKWRSK